MFLERYLQKQVGADLKKKMVFVGGPRQVGKTTLALEILGETRGGYLNWDIADHREQILKRKLPSVPLWVFDEIHKYRSWRNYLKGLYDQYRGAKQILVTGSARLDYYRFGGDSIQGRYHYLRLHPLSFAELKMQTVQDLESLLKLGGFPEPFFQGSETEAERWSREFRTRLVREDLTSLEAVQDLGNVELLMIRLPDLVGSPLSINGLREDLQISHKTVANWLTILERLYAIFRLSPFGSPRIRAVKKEQKHYHFDWTLVSNPSFRFENLVAAHLLKWVHFQQDAFGKDIDLRYFRDVEGREVDFVITKKTRPLFAVEAKWEDTEIGKGLRYFKEKFPSCEAWQISAVGQKHYLSKEGIEVIPAFEFLKKWI